MRTAENHRLLITASTFGHIRNFHLPYIERFASRGWTVDVACGGEKREIPCAGRLIELPFEKSFSSSANFRAAAILRREIRANGYDLIITHTSLAAFFTRLAVCGLKPRPKLVDVMHGYLFDDTTGAIKSGILKAAELFCARETDLLLVMNEYDRRWANAHRVAGRVGMIPGMGLNPARMAASTPREKMRAELGLKDGDFALFYAAEFSSRKNQAFLIEAMPRLDENVKLILAGRGERQEECKKLAHSLGVAERVLFLGQVPNVPDYLSASDAAITASRSEGLPFNVLEALYMGLPVAATSTKGHDDLIRTGENGILFPQNDLDACVAAINTLKNDPEFRTRMSSAAKQSTEPYLLPNVLEKVMDAYLSVLD